MAKKSDIKICRYQHCKHQTKDIDITCDEYVVKKSMYYHKDCYKAKLNGEQKDEATKADIQYIRNLWLEHISKTVVYSQLYKILNEYLDRGIESDYLVFVMTYVIEHGMNLRYPNGLKYYIDKEEIKDAYKKKKLNAIGYSKDNFVAVEKEDATPKFVVNKKPNGFQSIIKK